MHFSLFFALQKTAVNIEESDRLVNAKDASFWHLQHWDNKTISLWKLLVINFNFFSACFWLCLRSVLYFIWSHAINVLYTDRRESSIHMNLHCQKYNFYVELHITALIILIITLSKPDAFFLYSNNLGIVCFNWEISGLLGCSFNSRPCGILRMRGIHVWFLWQSISVWNSVNHWLHYPNWLKNRVNSIH